MQPATASLNATTLTQVGEMGRQRVIDNVVGDILVIIATVIVIAYSSWSVRRGHASDTDHELEAVSPAIA